ncbi:MULTISPECIES: hypothetical protein [unclassified Sphingobacterium]|uniref:hypothetical protein n=1 Tax=unclassified Sphingobacterium TaxID=2609468 RepID=UPI0025EA7216|nr:MULTISPECIES: hypothetical protein [unclassified Sphingobacterium]
MNKIVKRIIGTMSIGVMTLGISMGANAQSIKNEKEVKAEKEVKTSKETKIVRANQTWYFTGSSSDSPTDPSKYSTSLPAGKSCNSLPYQTVCELQAPANPSNPNEPDMNYVASGTETVEQRIEDAIETLQPSKTPTENETVTAFRKH